MSEVDRRQDQIRHDVENVHRAVSQQWRRPDEVPTEPLHEIAYWIRYEQLANQELVAAIDSARSAGAKWREVGAAMGRTSEAARAFYQYHRK